MEVRVAAAEVGVIVCAVWRVGPASSSTALRIRIVGIEVSTLTTAGTRTSVEVVVGSANGGRNRWGGAEAAIRIYAFLAAFFVDENDHPDTHCTSVTQ
jgi:hypothetical protein